MKKPDKHVCTRCGEREHPPTDRCAGKSRAQQQEQTRRTPKCACGNLATFGYVDCARCRENAERVKQTEDAWERIARTAENAESWTDVQVALVQLIRHLRG